VINSLLKCVGMRENPKKILLVEDNRTQRRLLEKIFLEGWDCEVSEAKDGVAALNILFKGEAPP